MSQAALGTLMAEVDDRTPAGIASAINRLIRSGTLAPGDRLPTVRAIAGELGVSLTTVSDAWRALVEVGAIQPRGRAGTYVRDPHDPLQPLRFIGIGAAPGAGDIDLSTGTP
ncbi:MAG: GntR family transcriptional regulator, partial [Actinomycetales bacterium]